VQNSICGSAGTIAFAQHPAQARSLMITFASFFAGGKTRN
jgi:hypothetical protein